MAGSALALPKEDKRGGRGASVEGFGEFRSLRVRSFGDVGGSGFMGLGFMASYFGSMGLELLRNGSLKGSRAASYNYRANHRYGNPTDNYIPMHLKVGHLVSSKAQQRTTLNPK